MLNLIIKIKFEIQTKEVQKIARSRRYMEDIEKICGLEKNHEQHQTKRTVKKRSIIIDVGMLNEQKN